MSTMRIWTLVALACLAEPSLGRIQVVQRKASREQARFDFRTTFETQSGAAASLTEEGYRRVANLKNDQEMEAYIRRILASEGLKVRDGAEHDLDGFTPFFSGTQDVQSLKQLRQELDRVSWVTRETNLEVDMALDTLKNERPSGLSNVSAYALAIANAMSATEGAVKPRIFVESELRRKPISVLTAELREVAAENAKVVLQREDGSVTVVDPDTVAVDFARMPLEHWADEVRDVRETKFLSEDVSQVKRKKLRKRHSIF